MIKASCSTGFSALKELEYIVYLYDGKRLVWTNEALKRMLFSLSGKSKLKFRVESEEGTVVFTFKAESSIRFSRMVIEVRGSEERVYTFEYSFEPVHLEKGGSFSAFWHLFP